MRVAVGAPRRRADAGDRGNDAIGKLIGRRDIRRADRGSNGGVHRAGRGRRRAIDRDRAVLVVDESGKVRRSVAEVYGRDIGQVVAEDRHHVAARLEASGLLDSVD